MLDFSHIPNLAHGAETVVFNALGANDWQTWVRPRGKSFASIIVIGGGAGGGGGFSGVSGSARGGGGGGGSSGICRINDLPLDFLPPIFFVNVGLGGLGGAGGGGAGAAGQVSVVSVRPDTVAQNRVAYSNTAVPTGGTGGLATAGGTLGAAGTTATIQTMATLATFIAIFGQSGSSGGAHTGAQGNSVTWASVGPVLSSGAGGAGVGTGNIEFPGGTIIGGGWLPTLAGGLAGPNRGQDGFLSQMPFAASGASGGGSSAFAAGGAGGDAAIGSGGAGGGGGVTGGKGGNGGHGLVMITCW